MAEEAAIRAVRTGSLAAGAAMGAAAVVGGMLLLYLDDRFLPTFGFLAALVLLAHAAGLWAGRPRPGARAPIRVRGGLAPGWAGAIAAFAVAAFFAQLWLAVPALREGPVWRAVGLVVFLAEPAYAAGALLAALNARAAYRVSPRRSALPGAAAPALVGAAVGILVTAGLAMPGATPATVYWAATALLVVAGVHEGRTLRRYGPRRERSGGNDMSERSVVITGVGDRGQVGYAVAESFLEAGARLVVTDVQARVEELGAELSSRGAVHAVRADLTRAEEAERIVAAAVERYGVLDVLVNVAGGLSVVKPIAETEPAEWEREISRNATTAFNMCRAAVGIMRERGGSIINFTAPPGLRAGARLGAYSAAKASVIALTRALALEEKRNGIRVNAIAPGMIDTAQNRRELGDQAMGWVRREEIAAVVVFLAGDAASGVSGEIVHVMGDALE